MDDETNLNQRDISRRKLLKVAGMGVGALALGGSSAIGLKSILSPTSAHAAAAFIKGADISWLPQMEATVTTSVWWSIGISAISVLIGWFLCYRHLIGPLGLGFVIQRKPTN